MRRSKLVSYYEERAKHSHGKHAHNPTLQVQGPVRHYNGRQCCQLLPPLEQPPASRIAVVASHASDISELDALSGSSVPPVIDV